MVDNTKAQRHEDAKGTLGIKKRRVFTALCALNTLRVLAPSCLCVIYHVLAPYKLSFMKFYSLEQVSILVFKRKHIITGRQVADGIRIA